MSKNLEKTKRRWKEVQKKSGGVKEQVTWKRTREWGEERYDGSGGLGKREWRSNSNIFQFENNIIPGMKVTA